jgi:hypothetical protein
MADKIIIDADTSGAISALERLSQKVEDVQKKFGDHIEKMSLAAAALGASLLAAGHEAAAFADEITDLAAANQLAIGEVLALSEALGQNGGKAENAGKMLQSLSNKIDEANGGNLKLVSTFGQLGLSMSDLGNLSQTQIRDKLLDSIAAISDPLERNAKAMSIFGKAAIGVDWTKLAEDQKRGREEQEKYAPALKSAGDAFDRLGLIAERTKIAFAQAFEPVFNIIKNLNPSVDDLTTKFRIMGAVLAVLVAGATVSAILKLKDAFLLLNLAVRANPLIALASAALAVGTYFALGAKKADDMSTAVDGVGTATGNAKRNQDDLNKALQDESDKITKIGKDLQANFDIALRKYDQETKNLTLSEDQKSIAEAIAKVEEDAIAAKKKAQDEYNSMSLDAQARQKATLDEQLKGIDAMSAAQKKAVEGEIQSRIALLAKVKDFNNAYSIGNDFRKLSFELQAKYDIDASSSIEEKIDKETRLMAIQKLRADLMSRIPELAKDEQGKAAQAISSAIDQVDLLKLSYYDLGETIKEGLVDNLVDAKISNEGFAKIIGQQQAGFNSLIQSAAAYNSEARKMSENSRSFATGWQNAFNDYVTNATNAATIARNVFQKFTQGVEDMFVNFFKTGKMDWKNFLGGIAEEIVRSGIRQSLAGIMQSVGLNKIFGGAGGAGKSRGDTITNPLYVKDVSSGQGAFPSSNPAEAATSGIGDSISSTISDFKDGVTNFLNNMFSGFGNFISSFASNLGSVISGFGGSLMDVLSSIGGTLWDVISGLGSSLGDVLGGAGSLLSGGGGGGSFLGDAISAVAGFFGFANGGVVPNNGPVLVGEKGPEIIFGSQGAAVVPMNGGGSTNITYNISAVDARSFKQLVAQDPTFLYAVTQQGAKQMPMRG